MKKKFLVLLGLLLLLIAGISPALAQGPGESWDQAICDGEEAVVWRVVNGTTTDMPAEEGCGESTDLGWLVVEPWGPDGLNPDRACLALTWAEAVEAAERLDWDNGSAWRVDNVELQDDPLVVLCKDVDRDAQLGLNPGEGQVELRTIDATVARAAILLNAHGQTMADWAEQNPDKPLSVLFNLFADLGISD